MPVAENPLENNLAADTLARHELDPSAERADILSNAGTGHGTGQLYGRRGNVALRRLCNSEELRSRGAGTAKSPAAKFFPECLLNIFSAIVLATSSAFFVTVTIAIFTLLHS